LGLLDQTGGLAGGSSQHRFGYESPILKFSKLKKVTPANRGEYTRFGHSVYYRGTSFTTDMPNIIDGDEDCITQDEKNMDLDKVKLAMEVELVLNEIKRKILSKKQVSDYAGIKKLKANLFRWTEKWIGVRKDLTLFYMVSSLVNVDILTEGYFADSVKALGIEEFKSVILSLKINLKKGKKFYSNLGERDNYDNGVLSTYYDKFSLTKEIEKSSLPLRYIDHNTKLEAGVDFGHMCLDGTAKRKLLILP
jgi:hypothetical protein